MRFQKALAMGFVLIMLLSGMLIVVNESIGSENRAEPLYVSHAPIRINNDTDFADQAVSEGWNGSGTQTDPYVIENYDIDAHGAGNAIYIGNTTAYFVIRNCILYNATYQSDSYYEGAGVTLYNVWNGTISNNTASNNYYGIYLDHYSSNNTISNNTASNNNYGIDLSSSSSNNISNNTANSNNNYGIYLSYSSSNTIANNNASNNEYGIYLWDSSSNTVSNNTANSNKHHGIFLYHSSSNTIKGNTMVSDGIFIEGDQLKYWNTHTIDTTNTVNGKPVYYWKNRTGGAVPSGAGEVILANCINVTVENQNVSDGSVGIELGFSNGNTVANNTASNSYYGIFLHYSSSNTISNNTVSYNSEDGIFLHYSSSNTISNNTVSYNSEDGIDLYYSSSNTISNNTANSNNWGGIYLYYSSSNTISNNTASNNIYGIYLDSSSSNTIYNNTASNNDDGIFLNYYSSSNTISNNTVSYNSEGICLDYYSSSNTISNNTASNSYYGIYIRSSSNTISNNTASNSYYGIRLDSSDSNRIYHNNFINNTNQAYDNTGNNFWNSSYPDGGNYWSDYNGTDEYSGPNQNENGSDGIGDTPYTKIDGGSGVQDNYPLMSPIVVMEINLNTGWNLITLPWQTTPISIEDALSGISWDRAMVYINDTWYTYNRNRDAKYNLGFPMVDNTIGIWVNCTSSGTLSGPDQNIGAINIPLHKGWNLVGFPSAHNQQVSDALAGIPWQYLETADANGNLYALSSDDYLISGKAYWIYVSEDCEWTVNW